MPPSETPTYAGLPISESRLLPRGTVLVVSPSALGMPGPDRLVFSRGGIGRIDFRWWWGTFADTLEALNRRRLGRGE